MTLALTEDSGLNGASPQFTLTCISTGGPATTVTWTRDSDTVTEGTETVLDDPVTAQYTHTLTVTGRLRGLYTCTVANDKPSHDSAQLSVQGCACKNIMLYEKREMPMHVIFQSGCNQEGAIYDMGLRCSFLYYFILELTYTVCTYNNINFDAESLFEIHLVGILTTCSEFVVSSSLL